MNESYDPFEAELAALRPHKPSPGLRRGIAERLASTSPARWRWLWGSAFVGGLAAACLVGVIVLRRGDLPHGDPAREVDGGLVSLQAAFGDVVPSLQAYQRALARSPDALDALLDQHAALGLGFHSEPVTIHAFASGDGQLATWLGER